MFFTSDNGPHKEGGPDPEFFQSAGPLRGIKRDLYEGGIRVPMIVRWTGTIRPGQVERFPLGFLGFPADGGRDRGRRTTSCQRTSMANLYLPTLLGKSQRAARVPLLGVSREGFEAGGTHG